MPLPIVLKDAFLSFAGNDVSAWLKEITVTHEVEEKDQTTMGTSSLLSFPALKKWRITGKLQQDFANLDQVMFPLVGDETPRPVEVRPKKALPVGIANPRFAGLGFLLKWPPISGAVGDIVMVDFDIAPASDLIRATA